MSSVWYQTLILNFIDKEQIEKDLEEIASLRKQAANQSDSISTQTDVAIQDGSTQAEDNTQTDLPIDGVYSLED